MTDLRGYVEGMINFEGDGTNVVANPTGTPTDELVSIQIGDVIYSISGGESIVPTPTNVDRSKYLGVKSDANELEYRAIRELPNSDGVEAGYVLTHTVSGDVWSAPASELPAYSTVQNDKVLGVHNGVLEWVAQSTGGGVNYSTDEQTIGRWIDNSPIYQKTFSPLNPMQLNSNTWNEVPYVDIPNGNVCIKTEVYLGGGEHSQSTFFGKFENGVFYIFSTISITISLVTIQYTKSSSS